MEDQQMPTSTAPTANHQTETHQALKGPLDLLALALTERDIRKRAAIAEKIRQLSAPGSMADRKAA